MKTIDEIDLKDLLELETGETFNKQGMIKSPFNPTERTASCTVYFNSDLNKYKFKDFSSGEEGDAIDFICKYRNMNYAEAREYLGLEVEKTELETEQERIWEFAAKKYKDCTIKGVFQYVDKENKPIYYKVKVVNTNNTKITPYYSIKDGDIVSTRGTEEVPYNYYNLYKGIEENKTIVIVEGEKDCNNVNRLLKHRGYVATSLKNCKDYSMFTDNKTKIVVIGDTGPAGEEYITKLKKNLLDTSKSFKIVTLPGLETLGSNMDVTDWLEAGNTRDDLLQAIENSLDLRASWELQQNDKGIYKTEFKEVEGETKAIRTYLTTFKLLSASKIMLVDEEREGIKLVMKTSNTGPVERIGEVSVFDDIKSFKTFLSSMELTFKGTKTQELNQLKEWINKYWAKDNEELHSGVKFKPVKDKLHFITQQGSYSSKGYDSLIKADRTNDIDISGIEPITKEELKELMEHLLGFTSLEKSLTIIGTAINNLFVNQAINNKIKLHHLLIVGESGSGKSTILSNVIGQLLNYPVKDIKSIGLITPFAFTKDLTSGNYTTLYDEFKPSCLDKYKIQKLSETLRNLYDRSKVLRGDKSLNTKEFQFSRPIILAGEETYPNSEKALMERSAIVYLSRHERTKDHTKNMNYLIKHDYLLNKLGVTLINKCLNMSNSDYLRVRERLEGNISHLNSRPLTTALNTSTGIEILNMVLDDFGLSELRITGFEKLIASNIKVEVLEDGEEVRSVSEQMLILFDNMIADGRVFDVDSLVFVEGTGLYIRNSEMVTRIHEYCSKTGAAEIIPLKLRDFVKQITKSGYMSKGERKQKRILYSDGIERKTWFNKYDLARVRGLGCYNIAPLSEFEEKVLETHNIEPVEEVLQEQMPF